MNICKPIVNNNGTDRAELVKERRDVADALRDALEAMALSRPHPRDYQTATCPL